MMNKYIYILDIYNSLSATLGFMEFLKTTIRQLRKWCIYIYI